MIDDTKEEKASVIFESNIMLLRTDCLKHRSSRFGWLPLRTCVSYIIIIIIIMPTISNVP